MADIKNDATLSSGLQVYYDFEEASGTRYDLTGNAQNLTDVNTVTSSASGKIGTCAVFEDANSEKFTVNDSASVSVADGWSISYWMYIDSTKVGGAGDYHASTGKRTGENGFLHYIENVSGTWYLYVASGSGAFTSVKVNTALSTNTWYHIVVYYNGANTKVYINGSSTTVSVPSITDPSSALEIGGGGGYLTWGGMIDEYGIWNVELTQAKVNQLYNSGSGLPYYDPADVKNDTTLSTSLVSYWKLDETSGTRNDSVGTNHLTDTNTVLYATGKQGNAADFELDNSEYLTITDAAQSGLDLTGNMSFSSWINLESLSSAGSDRPILSKWNGGGWMLYTRISSGTHYISVGVNSAVNVSIVWTPSTATWYHVVATYTQSSGATSVYLNGVLLGTGTASTTNPNNAHNFSIGMYEAGGSLFDGLIDEVGVWSKVMSVGEVRALYGYGTPPVYEASSGTTPTTTARKHTLALLGVG